MKISKQVQVLESYFVEQPQAITGLKTIQLFLFREILDYTVLRTEEDRELNVISTLGSVHSDGEKNRVAFLGSKQKAVESRHFERMLRTAAEEAGMKIEECYLKDQLCLECPRCGLFGGTNASASGKSKGLKANIKHRIGYSTAFSLGSSDELREALTFNGISDSDQTTGQTLGERVAVKPGSLFPSIVTLTGVTWHEFVLTVKTILSAHKYGAESRIGGDVRNHIVGIACGWEEIMTPLEFTLEIQELEQRNEAAVRELLSKYAPNAANPERIRVLSEEELSEVLGSIRSTSLDKEFLETAYSQVKQFRKSQEKK